MRPNYLIAPLVSLVFFGGYYVYWKTQSPGPRTVRAQPADPYAGRDGKKEAEADLAAGRLALVETGPQVGWERERIEIARTRYGVELRRIDATTEAAARYVDAFNRVMRPAVAARHGRGFHDQLHREALAAQAARPGP